MKKYILVLPLIWVAFLSCKKDNTNNSSLSNNGKVSDIDGNVYDTVKIGTQVWLKENLQTTHYRDGSPVTDISDSLQWVNSSTGASCSYNNDPQNAITYGRLYNWYAVNNPAGLCPAGWHIPTDTEWTVLTDYLGGIDSAGNAMKAISTLWNESNVSVTDASGFDAIPGGVRYNGNGTFYDIGKYGAFWSSTEFNENLAWNRLLNGAGPGVSIYSYRGKGCGLSCRCIRDNNY